MTYPRPDLQHPFQFMNGDPSRCSHFHLWLGGYVMCGLPESDEVHVNGPHLLTSNTAEQAYCKGDPRCCEFCAREAQKPNHKVPLL